MVRQIEAQNAPIPSEVIVLSRGDGGRKLHRFILTEKELDKQREGYQLNAIGRDPATGKKISLAPTTLVEVGRPVVNLPGE